jgi:hypothetical protein
MGKIGQAFRGRQEPCCSSMRSTRRTPIFRTTCWMCWTRWSSTSSKSDKTVPARHRPVIIITSNAKKDLSDPFLGRCNFHHIAFPGPKMMRKIIGCISRRWTTTWWKRHSAFYRLREIGRHREKTGHPGADQLDPGPAGRSGLQAQTAVKGRCALPGRAVQELSADYQRASAFVKGRRKMPFCHVPRFFLYPQGDVGFRSAPRPF